jgi:pentapeptide repeat protein
MSNETRPSIFQKLKRGWDEFINEIVIAKAEVKLGALLAPLLFRPYSKKERPPYDDQQSSLRRQERTITILKLLTAIIIIVVVGGIIAGYWFGWEWIGVGPSTEVTITTRGTEVTRTVKQVGGKTLWDWFQLLFIPVLIGGAAYWFRKTEQEISEKRAAERLEADRLLEKNRIAEERRQAALREEELVLQTYFDRMSELLLQRTNGEKSVDKGSRAIARSRTITVLNRLSPERKGVVLRFLYEAGLLTQEGQDKPFVDLSLGDLSDIDLMGANLKGANLSRTNLTRSKLAWANLADADLSRSLLDDAILIANFSAQC